MRGRVPSGYTAASGAHWFGKAWLPVGLGQRLARESEVNYAIISARQVPGEGGSAGQAPSQSIFRWTVSEPEVSGEQLGQMLKRYKNKMIIVVDAEEAADLVARLNQGDGRHPATIIAGATAADPDRSLP